MAEQITSTAHITFPGETPESRPVYYNGHEEAARQQAVAAGLGHETPDGFEYAGRQIIEGSTFPLEGKVDIRNLPGGGEALVVDSQKDAEGFQPLENAFHAELAANPAQSTRGALEAVYKSVFKTMEYDLPFVQATVASIPPDNQSRKVSLGAYISGGKGVCLHMALAEGWLGGKGAEAGLLKGTLNVEVSQRDYKGKLDAHAWGRYTPGESEDSDVYILDPAQKFFGTLKEAAIYGKWEYLHPGEKQELFALPLGEAVAGQMVENPKLIALKQDYEQFKKDAEAFDKTVTERGEEPGIGDKLRGAVDNFISIANSLLSQALDGKKDDPTYRQAINDKLLPYLNGMLPEGVRAPRPYDRAMIPDNGQVRTWLSQTMAAMRGYNHATDRGFVYTSVVIPGIDRYVRRALGE